MWKLSNDEVKAIVLHGESYAFTLWNDSFHFAIVYIVIKVSLNLLGDKISGHKVLRQAQA